MLKKIKELIGKCYLVGYIFWFLFAPPLFPGINPSIILAVFSLSMIVFRYRKEVGRIIKDGRFKKVCIFIISYIIIYLISWALSLRFDNEDVYGNGVINLYSILLNFGVTFICALYLISYCLKRKINRIEIIKYFVYAGALQLAIALNTLVSPEFKQWTLEAMMKETNEALLKSTWLTERRFYGFSNNLLDLFGFGIGILAILPLYYATIKEKKLFALWSPVLLILSILNARTGLVIYAIGIIVWTISLMVNGKLNIAKIFLTIPAIIIGLFASYWIVNAYSPGTIEWIKTDISSFFDDNTIGTASAINSEEFWTFPTGSDLIIGTGHNISAYSEYRVSGDVYSDNGYVNEIWKVGIIGLIIYLVLNFYILRIPFKYEKGIMKSLYVFFGLSIIVFLVKGSLMGYNPGNVIIYTLFLFAVLDRPNKNLMV